MAVLCVFIPEKSKVYSSYNDYTRKSEIFKSIKQ